MSLSFENVMFNSNQKCQILEDFQKKKVFFVGRRFEIV
eukprot:UN02311